MSSEITIKSCRICLTQEGTISLFDKYINDWIISDMILDCTGVKMLNDGFLKTICVSCNNKLEAAFFFKQDCENSDRKMQSFLFHNILGKSNVKLETEVLEVEWTNPLECNQHDDMFHIESPRPLKIEVVHIEERGTKQDLDVEEVDTKLDLTPIQSFQCDLCLKVYKRKQHLTRHRSIIHKERNNFKCDDCDRSFNLNKSLQRHKKTHTKIPSNPEIELVTSVGIVDVLIKEEHVAEAPIKKLKEIELSKCDICFKVFNHKRYLNMHMKRHEKKQFICEICSKQFWFSHDLLKHHKLTHLREKPYECETCHRCFSSQNVLKVHRRIHTGEKPFQCKYCGRKFRDMSGMNNHTKSHTGEKHHQCEICLKTYSRPSHLLNHKRSHTGEKPFECEICAETFSRNYYLIVHLRKHTGIKPFKCQFCEKPFRLRQNRTKHERIHTGEKPFKCAFCEAKYVDSYNLGIHMKHHCQNNPNRTKKEPRKLADISV